MSNDPLTGALTGESGFHMGEPHEGPVPQRIAGGTFAGEDVSEAVADRGARHIEMDGGAR